jgi:hypothetical protein
MDAAKEGTLRRKTAVIVEHDRRLSQRSPKQGMIEMKVRAVQVDYVGSGAGDLPDCLTCRLEMWRRPAREPTRRVCSPSHGERGTECTIRNLAQANRRISAEKQDYLHLVTSPSQCLREV